MQIQAFAKINWALNIIGTRPDGYHEMDMLMQSISLCDTIDIHPADMLSFDGDDYNLVPRAARALAAATNCRKGARIALQKRIPARAGLGGGSADAAATLIALNDMWGLGLSRDPLCEIGLKLGADVPFCVVQRPMRARGLGDVLTPISVKNRYELVLLHPGNGLSTPDMFRAFDGEVTHDESADIPTAATALEWGDLSLLNRSARNMLTGCAINALPEIAAAMDVLDRAGSLFTRMSGSGSAVFGVFEGAQSADRAAQQIGGKAIRAHTL